MKYWRGYLTAAVLVAITWALREFARTHTALVDMIYPYVTRMVQNFLVDWNSTVDYCLWQVLVLVILALVIASVVLMIVLKWNVIQWFGWVCTVVAAVWFLNTAAFGLNEFSGPLSEDIRLEETDYTVTELEEAAKYYLEQANKLSGQVKRDSNGDVVFMSFDGLATRAGSGFATLVYDRKYSVFAGSLEPVKKLGWEHQFSTYGITGVMIGLTGEAAVNPQTPAVMLPFVMCREMAHRMCILVERDANFGAYLACMANEDLQFQYSGTLMGYRFCVEALQALDDVTEGNRAAEVAKGENDAVKHDLAVCDAFFGDREMEDTQVCDLFASWHIQKVVLPSLIEEEKIFDPFDPEQVDLSGIVDAE